MFIVSSWSFLILILIIPFSLPQILSYQDDEQSDYVPRVVNGRPANLGDVPYQLAFKSLKTRLSKIYRTFCGGTLIGPTKVLSAAHCFQKRTSGCDILCSQGEIKKKTLDRTFAVAGNLLNEARFDPVDSMVNGQWRRLKSMYIPTNYKFPRNDIAVGFTRTAFVYNSHVNFIPYATVYRDYVGTCLTSGYGRISRYKQSPRLLLADLSVHSSSYCSRLHRMNMKKFVCTSDRISDVEKGDSGGPLVCTGTTDPAEKNRGIVVGVVSGNRRRRGSFFTRISSFKSFVEGGGGSVSSSGFTILICLLYSGILLLFCFIDF